MAIKFYRDNEGKRTFEMEYDDKVQLMSLTKQVSHGPLNQQNTLPDIGYLDMFGHDRRKAWGLLGDMSSNDARRKFIETIDHKVPVFGPFMIAHQKEKEEKERQRIREEEERKRLEEEKRLREEEERRKQEELEEKQKAEEKIKNEQETQKQQIMAALNAQTHAQFQQYAAQQYPGNADQQAVLIKHLQEQHYQQYMKVYLQQQQQQQQQQQKETTTFNSVGTNAPMTAVIPKSEQSDDTETEDDASEASVVRIAEPSMWTRPQLDEFKQQIKRDPESVLSVGRGEVVTVRVPTHEEGAYVFWEFATDSYDLGFGVYFEWTNSTGENQVSVEVGESTDDETDEEGGDLERGSGNEPNRPPIDEVVPVYRRDCHLEVNAGSHRYPGRGVYLLKFDNSYSLWRSKTLYYRVYYTR
uniref:Golgi resident protein GCP60 n=1 Tax=Phallusia mammillata TaxID=59560 RepID=A0A6F9D656_9ASCI|nr:Golgi resident protein GCP60 [Phallusia mammillata]